MDTNIRITGEAGQGVQTIGGLLADSFAALGLNVYATQSYMSRIRGGVNSYDIRISDAPLYSAREEADLLVALNRESLDSNLAAVSSAGKAVFDGADGGDSVVSLDMTGAAKEAGGSARMVNSVAAGVVFAALGYKPDRLFDALTNQFKKLGEEAIAKNHACVGKGIEIAGQLKGAVKAPEPGKAPLGEVVSGSEAIGLSAAVAGVKVVSSYPMTPSTGVFTHLAYLADKYGIVVEQAEDEIAAINLVCGATFAGVPAMTTTSGGGFALMAEGISLSGMLELPAVVFLSQRPGPATSQPTRTAQQDLHFAAFAGHGEFARAIYAPGTIAQAYDLMRKAFETAHKFQSPAILMADQFITDLQQNIAALSAAPNPIDRLIIENHAADYVRYAVTDSGISPRAIPGGGAFVVLDSDEHTPDGHLTEDLDERVMQQDKRMRKEEGMIAEVLAPEIYPLPAAEVFLCWGSSYGPCREAVDILRARGRDVCLAHFPQVWPIDPAKALAALGGRKVTAVEGNCNAQFALLLRMAGALGEFGAITRYDGLPFTAEYIVRRAQK
ncbi:MAG: 2-oxoacid:acceptor oxidoreductase subunit alpha [bacterium]